MNQNKFELQIPTAEYQIPHNTMFFPCYGPGSNYTWNEHLNLKPLSSNGRDKCCSQMLKLCLPVL